MLQRVGEQHRYSNAIKDEVDRVAEKVRGNQQEVLAYNKSLAGTLKKLRGDQVGQDEDLNRVWQALGFSMDSMQNLMSFFENQTSGNAIQQKMAHQAGIHTQDPTTVTTTSQENILRQAGEHLKRVQLSIHKRNATHKRLTNVNTTTTNTSGKLSPSLAQNSTFETSS
jgi:hypothetical protein